MIKENYDKIQKQLLAVGPTPPKVVAVIKKQPYENVRSVVDCGVRHLGVNFVEDKESLSSKLSNEDLKWHFIGNIQSKKLKKIVGTFDLIHSVFKLDHISKINMIAKSISCVQKVLIQVNLSEERSKGGVNREDLLSLIKQSGQFQFVKICGLMTMPPLDSQVNYFTELKLLKEKVEVDFNLKLPNLSMGTSSDFLKATEAGATHIRLGQVLLGERGLK